MYSRNLIQVSENFWRHETSESTNTLATHAQRELPGKRNNSTDINQISFRNIATSERYYIPANGMK